MNRLNILFVLLFAAGTAFAQVEVLPNGNLGIGTENPQYRLDVVGNARVSGNINTASGIIRTTALNVPIAFRVGNSPAGFTGSFVNSNVSFGLNALNFYRSGRHNTAIGVKALDWNEGSYNTALGSNALNAMMTGSFNTAVGAVASTANMFGSRNTIIGAWAGGWQDDLNNTIVIGYRAMATGSNQIRLGNIDIESIVAQVGLTTFSDGRAKRSIRAEVPGLDFINRLQPVIYTLNLDVVDELMGIDRMQQFALDSELGEERCFEQERLHTELLEQKRAAREIRQNQLQTGFIAQDVRAAAESIGFDFSGVDVDELGIYGLRYSEFVVPLVRAVQELSQQNIQQQAEIEQLRTELRALQAGIIGIPAPPPAQTMSAPAPASNDDWTSFDETTVRTASLYQNVPNPFRQGTEIRFYLPQTVATAFLIFYDLQGRQLHQITLTQRGEGVEFIQGSQFAPGIYLYALIADGQVAAVKQMIITE